MLLGQLYYFEKKLESVKFLVESGDVERIEIIGIETATLKLLKNLPTKDVYTKLLVAFNQKYSEILEDEGLFTALKTWRLITNPYKPTQQTNNDPIYEQVNSWLEGSEEAKTITQLLDNIGFSQEDEEFAVIYGLSVLKVLLGNDNFGASQSSLNFEEKHINADQKAKIIVVCPLSLSPLMTNLNCIFIDTELNQASIVTQILEYVSDKSDISLILVEEKKWEQISTLISRRLERPPLIAPLNLDAENNTGYFDNLVKKTLGVRLV